MGKTLKKSLSIISSAAIAATMLTVPVLAENASTASYKDGKLTVTADKAYENAELIVANYKSDKTLNSVKTKTISINEGENVIDTEANADDVIMLWTADQKAIINKLTVTNEGPEPTDPTPTPTGVPTPSPAPTEDTVKVIKSWKFDFGSSTDVEQGYTYVSPDTNYSLNTSGTEQYGFLGTTENDYKLGNRLDGFGNQEGQVIELTEGGGTGLNDGIGSTGEDVAGNAGDKYYPVRFALKVQDEQYFRVKATVTTLDNTKSADASLYTERKHPIFTQKEIKPGETVTAEFTIRTTPIYYQKSDPQGSIADEMVNVAVLGENTALAALEIDQIEDASTLWVVGDSTVTDGNCNLPYWPLQNYTGVGTGLTKYLPSNIAMVNEGEGGLSATDNYHFNMIKNRIKKGDYLYMEYGHNHKNSNTQTYTGEYWLNNYLQALPKYYDACTAVGATYIVVGPIDRHNNYDPETNIWSTSLAGFSQIGENYVKAWKYGGKTAAEAFLAKWQEIANCAESDKTGSKANDTDGKLTALKAEAQKIVDDAVAAGQIQATDIAFVDLNQPSLDWFGEISKSGSIGGNEVTNSEDLVNYYFQTSKGGKTDGTHPNDTGAENLAYCFYTTADTDAYPALKPLMANFEDGTSHETPSRVPQWVMDAGKVGGDAWPSYSYNKPEWPVIIKDITINDENQFVDMTTYVQDTLTTYALGVLEILDESGGVVGTYYTTNHIDNTTGNGTNVLTFSTENPIVLGENQTYRAYIWSCDLTVDKPIPADDGGKQLSTYYTPTDIDTYMLPGEDTDVETFSYFGKTQLTDSDTWKFGGSAGHDFTLGTDGDVTYTRVMSDGVKLGLANQGSFYLMRSMTSDTGTSGKYIINADVKYVSGGGVKFAWSNGFTANKSPFVYSEAEFVAFTIGSNGKVTVGDKEVGAVGMSWTNVKYILNMDAGTAEISVGGGTPVVVDIADYQKLTGPSIPKLDSFIIEGQKTAFDINVSNLTVGKLKQGKTVESKITVNVADDQKDMGTVSINGEETYEKSVQQGSVVTLKATAKDNYVFTGWTYADGSEFTSEAETTAKIAKDTEITATFAKQNGVDSVKDFNVTADKGLVKAGSDTVITLMAEDVVDEAGNPVKFTANDVSWSCNVEGVTVEGGVLSAKNLSMEDNTTLEIPVNATINNITKTFNVIAYSYDFYENVNGGKTTSAFDGDVTSAAGKNAIAFPAGGKSNTLTFSSPVSLDGEKTLSYNAAWTGSKTCGQPRCIEIYDSNGNKVVNELIGYSWEVMNVGGTINSDKMGFDNGTNFASAITQNAWNGLVTITINKETGTGTVLFGDITADITVNTNATDIASIKLVSTSGAPNFNDRGLLMTDITIK